MKALVLSNGGVDSITLERQLSLTTVMSPLYYNHNRQKAIRSYWNE